MIWNRITISRSDAHMDQLQSMELSESTNVSDLGSCAAKFKISNQHIISGDDAPITCNNANLDAFTQEQKVSQCAHDQLQNGTIER